MNDKPSREPVDFATFLMRWNSEMTGLYNKRLQEYAMLPGSLMLCCSADDLADLQDKFAKSLKLDYALAAEKLALLACERSVAGAEQGESYASVILAAQEDARAIIAQAQEQARRILEQAENAGKNNADTAQKSAAA